MVNYPLVGSLTPSAASLPRPKRDWRASLFDRLGPSSGVPGFDLSDDEKERATRQGLLGLAAGLLGTPGGFGNALGQGIQGGLLALNQGAEDTVNNRYKQQMMQRTMAGADRNTQAEELARRAVRQDGTIDQQVYSQLAALDPDRAKSLRDALSEQGQKWIPAEISDPNNPGNVISVIHNGQGEFRYPDMTPVFGGFGQSPSSQGPNIGVVQEPEFEQLAAAVMAQESGGNPNAVSPKGAMGTMQTMPGTLRDPGFGVAPAKDNSPAEMQRVGVDYLREMIGRFGPEGGLAAYNWGPGNWERALAAAGGDVQRALASAPRETQNYVPGVQRRLSQVPPGQGMTQRSGSRFSRPRNAASPQERYRTLSAEEIRSFGLPEGTVAQMSPVGQLQIVNKSRDLPGAQTQVIDNGDGTQTIIPAGKTTEDQNKSAGYALRMEQALKDIAQASAIDPNANRPGLFNAAVDMLPDAAGNYFKSTGRQNVEAAQLDALDAALTLNTGAAYTKEQLRGLAKSYFPQPGNTPEVIKQKEERLRSLIQTARLRARGAYPTTGPAQASDAGKPKRLKFNPSTGKLE